jgi:hypothetical protein
VKLQLGSLAPGRLGSAGRELNTLLVVAIVLVGTYLTARAVVPGLGMGDIADLTHRFVGPAWPFFSAVALFLTYVSAAWAAEAMRLVPARTDWGGFARVLHWATEACPLVGLITTFLSLLQALLVYAEAGGPGNPEVQAAFIGRFGVAFGSSIAGGILALMAFTLHRIVVDE